MRHQKKYLDNAQSKAKQNSTNDDDSEKKPRSIGSSKDFKEKRTTSGKSEATFNEKPPRETTSSTSATAPTVIGNDSEGASGVGIWDVPHLEKKSKKKGDGSIIVLIVPRKMT